MRYGASYLSCSWGYPSFYGCFDSVGAEGVFVLDKLDLLKELVNLRRVRELEHNRADLVASRSAFSGDLDEIRLGILLRFYIAKKIRKLDREITDYNWRITECLEKCRTVQNELPLILVLDSRYVACAIDDVVTGRAESVGELVELFKSRKDAYMACSAALLDEACDRNGEIVKV